MKKMKRLLYVLYSLCIATPIWTLITALTTLSIAVAAAFGETDKVSYYTIRIWSKTACWLYLIKVEVYGKEILDKNQSYIFVANHQGYADIVLLYGYLGHPYKWMLKEYLRKAPFIGYACEKSKQIYVGDSRQSIAAAIDMSRETLRNSMSMMIFPEGTRSYDGKLGAFKRGAFMLANEIDLPIVPITINGSYDVWPRKDKWMHAGTMSITVHNPITPEERKGKSTAVIMDDVWNIINSGIKC